MDDISERIKILRKDTRLSQTEFGKPIGLSRDEVKNIELGRTRVKEITIPLLCSRFKVSEDWLRTGSGEMYAPQTKREQLADFLGCVMKEDSTQQRIISALSNLPVEYWEMIADVATRIAAELKDKKEESGD